MTTISAENILNTDVFKTANTQQQLPAIKNDFTHFPTKI